MYEMLQRITSVNQHLIDEKKQDFELHIDEKLSCAFIGDEKRLAQLTSNLLSNAVKFTSERGVIKLHAELAGEDVGYCTVCVKVTDTGIGISPEQQSGLFDAFSQADSNRTRKFGGTGLGLAICKGIVDLMGGKIWVESVVGVGSAFTYQVRLKQAENKKPVIETDEETEIFPGHRVLLTDDVDLNREIVLGLLESTMIEFDCAENGQIAVDMFNQNPDKYSLIFMDMQMPVMDGLTAAKTIRALDHKRAKEIPIIAMTANVTPEDVSNCMQAGMNMHIGKPIDYNVVVEALKKHLR